jgi:hypothetical protein
MAGAAGVSGATLPVPGMAVIDVVVVVVVIELMPGSCTITSTRRFCWRPPSVLLLALGALSPRPRATSLVGDTPAVTISARTASARRCERSRL